MKGGRVNYPPPPEPFGRIPILRLRVGMCRWPCVGTNPPYLYCGRPTAVINYCEEHAAIAFQGGKR